MGLDIASTATLSAPITQLVIGALSHGILHSNSMKKNTQPLRVGFDLDGVLLYNPTRVARPIISTLKRFTAPKRKGVFYVPESATTQKAWNMLHATSMFIEPGYEHAKILIKKKKIEAYIVTARYGFLSEDFEKWQKKLDAKTYFKQCFFNQKNEQPHAFKQRMIEKLDLDVFIEDNWDIVKALSQNPKNKNRRIYWIYNMIDRWFIKHPYMYPSLASAMRQVEVYAGKKKSRTSR